MMSRLRQYFITGLLVWLPMGVTVWVLLWLVGILDGIFLGVLAAAEAVTPGLTPLADQLRRIPGLGVILVPSSSSAPVCSWPTCSASGQCASGTS